MGAKKTSGAFPKYHTKKFKSDDISPSSVTISSVVAPDVSKLADRVAYDRVPSESSVKVIDLKDYEDFQKVEGKKAKNRQREKAEENTSINRNSPIEAFEHLSAEARNINNEADEKSFLEKHKEFKINDDSQNVHRIPISVAMQSDKSIISCSLEKCQRLVMDSLKNMIINKKNYILVQSKTPLGKIKSRTTGKYIDVSTAKIHYGKNGAHIVPVVITDIDDWRKL